LTEYVSGTALAVHLGCTRETVNDYVARKIIKRAVNGKYDQDKCRLQVFAYLRDKAGGRTGEGEKNLSEARAELAREQTASVALKNQVARGEYVPMALVMRGVTHIFQTFRERCLSIPGKIASACEMRSRGEVEEIVRGEIYEVLEVLSQPILSPAEPPPGDDVAGDDGDDREPA
jgi:phage terminase Nu1 subunit (DNA packaging protein)